MTGVLGTNTSRLAFCRLGSFILLLLLGLLLKEVLALQINLQAWPVLLLHYYN